MKGDKQGVPLCELKGWPGKITPPIGLTSYCKADVELNDAIHEHNAKVERLSDGEGNTES